MLKSYQREILKASLKDEAKILSQLENTYKEARSQIKQNIKDLIEREANARGKDLQSIIYQKQYQQSLDEELKRILSDLRNNSYSSIKDYLDQSYRKGFMGSMYSLQKQGVPLIFPIDQEKVTRAILNDSKLSTSMYKKLGINMKSMKSTVKKEISRGIASGSSFAEIARNIDSKMNSGLYNSQRIARTEGHRVSMEAKFDCMKEAEDNGAEILKQWDSTLDGRTRPDHQKLDGQIRKLSDPFEITGADGKVHKAMYPNGFGEPSEDINCRCTVLEIGKWELDEGNKEYTKFADNKGIVTKENLPSFQEYCNHYNETLHNVLSPSVLNTVSSVLNYPVKTEESHYKSLLEGLDSWKVEYRGVSKSQRKTQEEIISVLGGGDRTQGSCASVGLAYIGQKNGMDVLDFRDGDSRKFFSNAMNLKKLSEATGIKSYTAEGACSLTVGNRLLKNVEVGKEYYLCVGKHASIVRKTNEGVLQYLELQSNDCGWKDFNKNPKYTLNWRFGCTNTSDYWSNKLDFLMDIEESNFDTDEFRSILGYINTQVDKQRKGTGGTIK